MRVGSHLVTFGETDMRLSTPTFMTLLVSMLLAVIGLIAHFGVTQIPVVGSHSFTPLLLGYIVLLAGVLVRGL